MRSTGSGARPVCFLLFFCSLIPLIAAPDEAGAVVYVHQSPVALSWGSADGPVDHYNIYLSTNNQPFVLRGQATSNSLSLPVADGSRYLVQVEAESAEGAIGPLSDPSDELVVFLNGSAADTDGDSMPNAWEVLYGLSPYTPADGAEDADGDGLSNAAEYLAGTVPTDPDTDDDGVPDGAPPSGGQDDPPQPDPDCAEWIPEDAFLLPEAGAYGKISGGDPQHVQEVHYAFAAEPGNILTVSYQAWDVDFAYEVEILVNGQSVGFAAKTGTNVWGPTQTLFLPDNLFNESCPNLLTFRNTYNPPRTFWWGVREVQLGGPPHPLPDTGAYGRIPDGDLSHGNQFVCSFSGTTGNVTLRYEAYDVDYADEVEITVNGEPIDFAPKTVNNSWGPAHEILVPDEFVNNSSTNLVIFRNTRNPPKKYWWGVRNISLQ
ncbi:MAG: hypothetical protein AB1640_17885 [bacterium]